MEVIETVAKKWGNSMGVVIPRKVLESEHIKENQKVKMLIWKDGRKSLKETFGTMKFGKSAQKMKDEIRSELYD